MLVTVYVQSATLCNQACITSNCTRPSMLTSLDSRVPTCFDWKVLSLILDGILAMRPKKGKERNLSAW